MADSSATRTKTASGLESLGHEHRRALEKLAKKWLDDQCPYAFVFRDVMLLYDDDVLILDGRVPTFFLKQALQEVLGQLSEMTRIDNRVDVVSSDGLSSMRPR